MRRLSSLHESILKFHKTRFYPFKQHKLKGFKYEAIVGIGGNKGNVKKTFNYLFIYWKNDRRIRILQTSDILQNPPFGYANQSSFLNAVMKVQTSLSPKKFLNFLMHSEKRFKRVRSFKNAPRTLDLDIIFFNGFEQNDKRLNLPHPHWQERISVKAPLLKIL